MRVLIVQSWTPSIPPRNGADLRLTFLAEACRAFRPTEMVLPARFPAATSYGRASELAARWGWLWLPRSEVSAAIDKQSKSADVIVFHRLATWWASGRRDVSTCVVDVDDIPSQICQQGLQRGPLWLRPIKWLRYRWVRWAERHGLRAFGAVLVCSEDDARYLGLRNVHVIPNVIPPSPPLTGDSTLAPSDLLFVGELSYGPNVQGLQWFVNDVLPLILRRRPNAVLRVVGRVPATIPADWTWRFADGVEFVGPVDAIPPYLQATKLSICPLHEGRGTRIKILESLAHERVVVSTPLGAYGTPFGEQEGLFRSESPAEFAQTCLRLIDDDGQRQAAAFVGRNAVRDSYAEAAVAQRFHSVLQAIAADSPKNETAPDDHRLKQTACPH